MSFKTITVILFVGLVGALDLSVGNSKNGPGATVSGISGNQMILSDKDDHLVGTISVGNPLQDINVLFDSNSGVLWVPNSECGCGAECSFKDICYDVCSAHCCGKNNDEPEPVDPENPKEFTSDNKTGYCTNKNTFNSKDSKSYQDMGKTVAQPLEDKTVKINVGFDKFRFGPHHANGLNSEKLQFGTVKEFPSGYENLPFDGIFGLARTGPNGLRSPMRQLIDSSMQTPTVTLFLSKNLRTGKTTGLINVGQIDTDRCFYEPSKFAPLINKNDWSFRLFRVRFNNTDMNKLTWTATIDTTSPYFKMPKDLYDGLVKKMGGVYDSKTDTLTAWCSQAQQIMRGSSIFLGSSNFLLDPQQIIEPIGDTCIIKIRPSNEKEPQWVLGRPFLYNKCTFLDYSGRIGFGLTKIKN